MRNHICRKILTGFLLLLFCHEAEAETCVREGICDLSQVDWKQGELQVLSGDWQFYWNQLITPEELAQGKGQQTGFFSPDLNWTQAPFPEVASHATGYATYHLQFKLGITEALTIRIPEMASALRVWVNGKEIDSVGQVGTDKNGEIPRKRMVFHQLVPEPGYNTITLQLSNFSRLSIGSRTNIMIGPSRTIIRNHQVDLVKDLFSIGAIFIMAFYHFYLWWIRKNRVSPLLFGLFCLGISVRAMISGEGEVMTLLYPGVPLEIQFKLEYMGLALGFMTLTLLIHELYPKEFSRYISHPVAAIAGLWLLMIIVTPATIYPLVLRPMQLLIAVAGTCEFVALILASVRRREGARIFLAGFALFFIGGISDILSANSIIQMQPLAHVGTLCLVFSQAILLSKRFDQAFDQVEQTEKEVRQLNEVLEHKVKERTDQINTILTNVTSGFLLIDRQGRILPGFTESCRNLLGVQLEAGQILSDAIQLDKSLKKSFRVAITQVFEDSLPTEVSLSQIPSRVRLKERTLGLSCVALRDATQCIHALLFTIHDATDLQEAEHHVRVNEMLLGIIQEKESFKFFMKDYREELKAILIEAEQGHQPKLRSFLHTLKGNLAAFAIQELVTYIHQIEGQNRLEKSDIIALADRFEDLLNSHEKILRLGTWDQQIMEVNRDDFLAVEAYVRQRIKDPDRALIIDLCQKSRQMSIQTYIGPMENSAINLAQRLGKSLRCEIEGKFLRVDEQYAFVLRNLIHIIRNSVDHGIELPEDRGDKGPEGFIRIHFVFDSDSFRISVEDDGAGLKLDKIREKALQLGMAPDRMSDEDLTRAILQHGFSTADSESLISGRGVGMAAVYEAVQKLNGSLDIKNQIGRGVRFEIKLPLLGTHNPALQDLPRNLQIV